MSNPQPTEIHKIDIHDVKPKTRLGFNDAEWNIAFPLLEEVVSMIYLANVPALSRVIEVSSGRIVEFHVDNQT